MKIEKIETNYKRKLYLYSNKIRSKDYKESYEKNIINVYTDIEYQTFIGFGGAITRKRRINL